MLSFLSCVIRYGRALSAIERKMVETVQYHGMRSDVVKYEIS